MSRQRPHPMHDYQEFELPAGTRIWPRGAAGAAVVYQHPITAMRCSACGRFDNPKQDKTQCYARQSNPMPARVTMAVDGYQERGGTHYPPGWTGPKREEP
jgi:hypothetical protein